MDFAVFALAFVGFSGGLQVTARMLAWWAGLHAAWRRPAAAVSGRSARAWRIALLLHSGPWLLAVAAGIVRYVASSKRPELLWALVGGYAVAMAFLFITAMASRSLTQPRPALTPERLVRIRQEFFVANMALFGIATTGIAGCSLWNTLDRDYPVPIIVAVCSPASGWLFSLVFWQWYGTALEVAEKKRRQRAEREAGSATHAG